MSFGRERSCAYIEEYIVYRSQFLWQNWFHKLIARFTNFPMALLPIRREQQCWELIDKIKKAETVTDLTTILDLTGTHAREAQALKKQTKKWAAFDEYNLFVEDNSLYSKLNHAVRVGLVGYLNNSAMKKDFLAEIDALKKKYDIYDEAIELTLGIHVKVTHQEAIKLVLEKSVAELKSERQKIVMQLLDRQDNETWKMAIDQDQDRYLKPFPKYDIADLVVLPKLPLDPNRPTVYNNNYDKFYHHRELQTNNSRKAKYNEILLRYLREKEKSFTIEDEHFLDEATSKSSLNIHSFFLIENYNNKDKPDNNNESNKKPAVSTQVKLKQA